MGAQNLLNWDVLELLRLSLSIEMHQSKALQADNCSATECN